MTAYESWHYDPATYPDHALWSSQVAIDPEGRKWPVMSYSSGPQTRVTVVEYAEQVEHVGVPRRPRGQVVDQSPGFVKAEPFRDYGPEKNRRARPLNPIRDDPCEAEPYQAKPQPEPSHPHPRNGPLGGSGQGSDQPPGVNCEDGLCTFDENRDKPRDYGGQKLGYRDPTAERYEQPREYGINRREKPSESKGNKVSFPSSDYGKSQREKPGEANFPSSKPVRDHRNDRSKDLDDPKYQNDWFQKRKMNFGHTSPPSQANLVEKAPNKNQWDKPGEANFPLNNSYRPQMHPRNDRYGDSERRKPSYGWPLPPGTTTNKNYWDKPSDPHNDRFKDLDDVKHLGDQPKDNEDNQRGKVTYGWTPPPSQPTPLEKATKNMGEALQQLQIASHPSSPRKDINNSEADRAKQDQKQITRKEAIDKYRGRHVRF